MTLSPAFTISSSTLPLPSWAHPAYSENSNASCQILPQSLQRTNQHNEQSDTILSSTATEILNGEWINGTWVQNDMTLSPTSMLSTRLTLDSDPPPYSEIGNGECLHGTCVQHSNCEPLPLQGASESFSASESEATYNTQNETTISPNPVLYSYSS